MFSNILWFLICALAAANLSACSSAKDSDKVAAAQECLDSATAATALACTSKVDGVESEAAYLIRCSGQFIAQNFTDPTRLADINAQLKSSSSSSVATAGAVGLLAFTQISGLSTSAVALADQAFSDCTLSKSKGMLLLASMSQIATNLSDTATTASCQTNYNSTNCSNAVALAICTASGSTISTMGTAVLTAYANSCVGGTQENSSVCTQFATAVSGANNNPSTVGSNLQSQLCHY